MNGPEERELMMPGSVFWLVGFLVLTRPCGMNWIDSVASDNQFPMNNSEITSHLKSASAHNVQLALATCFDIRTPDGSPKSLDDHTDWQVEQEPWFNHNSPGWWLNSLETYAGQLESLTRFSGKKYEAWLKPAPRLYIYIYIDHSS